MRIDIITIFPELFPPYLNESLLKRAQKKRILKFGVHDLRDFTEDKHHKVDDRPYGGGPGMILKVEPIVAVLRKVESKKSKRVRVIAMDPGGTQLTQTIAKRLAGYDQLILLAGRYEGYDARVYKFVDERISIGPYVLAGGELPALVLVDTVTRQIPGVLGDPESLKEETHSTEGYVEYPQFTRPETFRYKLKVKSYKLLKVPKILLSGNHAKIAQWRKRHVPRRP